MSQPRETNLALFIDFDNLAIGARDARQRLDIKLLIQRILEKGKIIVKRAYADWHHHKEHMSALHEAAIDLIEVPAPRISGKNSADIRMVVDAMDLCYAKEHVDTFVICSGDSDFSPLVSKLRENNKRVIGVGMKNSSSNLLIGNCDEFIFYDDIYRLNQAQPAMTATNVPLGKREMFDFLVSTVQSLLQERGDVLYSSLIKDTMTRKQPHFSERALGYATFGDVLEEARNLGLLEVERDARSGGTWVVHGLAAGAPTAAEAVAAAASPTALAVSTADKPAGGRSSRRRRRSGRGGNGGRVPGEAATGGAEASETSAASATPAQREHRQPQADKPTAPATVTPAVSTTGGADGLPATAGKDSASRKTSSKPTPRPTPRSTPKPAPKAAPTPAPAGKAPVGKAPVGKATAGKAPAGKAPAGKAPAGKAPAAASKAPRTKVAPVSVKKAPPATGGRGTTKKAAMRPRATRRAEG
jgi:uncharacterized protein (TIGR00288 family)